MSSDLTVWDRGSFSVSSSSIAGLIGKNGAGKGSTINTMRGLIQNPLLTSCCYFFLFKIVYSGPHGGSSQMMK